MTADELKNMIIRLCGPFDALDTAQRDPEVVRAAVVTLTSDDRRALFNHLDVLAIVVAGFKAMLGDGERDLLGAMPDPAMLICLLAAVDPARLSIDVIDRLSAEAPRIFRGYTALPKPLFDVLMRRMDDEEEAYSEMEREEAEARRPTAH